jgi:hypothetical protein
MALIGYTTIEIYLGNQAKGMPKDWSYTSLKLTESIITQDVSGKFNVVNLLSGDTKFFPLRYLLKIKGKHVESSENYKISINYMVSRNQTLWLIQIGKLCQWANQNYQQMGSRYGIVLQKLEAI